MSLLRDRPCVAMMLALASGILLAIAGLAPAAIHLKLVSRASGGEFANGHSRTAQATAITPDGNLVVFQSAADNLEGGDGVTSQIYVRNIATGKTRLASADPDGLPGADGSFQAGVSSNGRFVAFQGDGGGFPGANAQNQIWVRDRKRQRTFMASRANDTSPGDGGSSDVSLSGDGSRVAFSSFATNLPHGTTPGAQVYIRNLDRKRTILVSKTNGGDPATGSLYGQTISSDGRRVVFYSADPGLPGGAEQHVYVRDLDRGRTILVDRKRNGAIANDESNNASISGKGRFVVFESKATNLPDPGASTNQIYVRDLKTGRIRLAGRNNVGKPQNGYAEFAHLSGSGRFVQFCSNASNLPGDNGFEQTYVRDMREGRTRLVSRSAGGAVANGEATDGSISVGGAWVVFESGADNLGGDPDFLNVFRVGPLR